MLQLKEWLVSTIENDTTLSGYLTDSDGNLRLYPADVDIQPEGFPAVTYLTVSDTVLSTPQGVHVGRIQLDIWSIVSALEVATIADRLGTVLNFQHSRVAQVSFAGTLWWVRQESARDFHTPGRRIWRTAWDLKYWGSNDTNT